MLKFPVAANCSELPAEIDGLTGVTLIDVIPFAFPVPLSGTMLGLPNALSLMVNCPVATPSAVGANVTPIVQELSAPMPEPQVLLRITKFWLAVIEEKFSSPLRWLTTVTVFAGLVVPRRKLPKDRLTGETDTGATPAPLTLADCGLVSALSVIVTLDVKLPKAAGENVTPMLQLAPPASVLGAIGQFPPSV